MGDSQGRARGGLDCGESAISDRARGGRTCLLQREEVTYAHRGNRDDGEHQKNSTRLQVGGPFEIVPPNSHRQALRLLESRLSKRIFIVFSSASGGSKRRLTPECSFFGSAPREVEDHP